MEKIKQKKILVHCNKNNYIYKNKDDNKFFNLNSNNIGNLLFENNNILLLSSYRNKISLNCPITKNLELNFLDLEKKCSDIYNQFPLLLIYLHNLNNLFIPNNINSLKIPNNIINIINLKKRIDRWENINTYNFKRFEIKRYNAFESRIGFGWEGCARSHVDLVIEAKKKNLKYTIVAEDDFINTIKLDDWEDRLFSILSWLSKYEDWEIFNGLPTGLFNEDSIKIINRDLGLVEMEGGFNTHFIIYNNKSYDKIINWYNLYDPTGLRFENKFPDLSLNSNIKNHLMAIDVYISNNFISITTLPLLTCSNWDDSDIVGSHTDEKKNNNIDIDSYLKDFNGWLKREDSRLNVKNYTNIKFKQITNKLKNESSFIFYHNTIQEYFKENKKEKCEYTEELKKKKKEDAIKLNKIQMEAHFDNFSQKLSHFYDSYNFLIKTEKMFGNILYDEKSDVTVVITSCNRWQYLYKTLSTFMLYNSYAVKNIIITEDSGSERMKRNILKHFPFVQLIFDGQKKGQLERIKEAWSHVDTKYVFHMEDDWEFLHSFFIEKSKKILEKDNKILNIWIRDIDDTNLHPIEPELYNTNGIYNWKLKLNYNNDWHGFTWNPTLMLYKKVYPEILKVNIKTNDLMPEIFLSNRFKEQGLRSAIIPGGFIRHIGEFSSLNQDIKAFF